MRPTLTRHLGRALPPGVRASLSVGMEGLSRHKLRSGLSILGVVLGVAAVIAMMSVSEGARREILRQVEQLGLNNVVVRPRRMVGTEATTPGGRFGLTVQDVKRIRTLVPMLEGVSPVSRDYHSLSGPQQTRMATMVGTDAAYRQILGLELGRGRFLRPGDDATRVCVLGATLSQSLFGYRNPIGEAVHVGTDSFRVIGVLTTRSITMDTMEGLAPIDLNQAAIVPLGAMLGYSAALDLEQPIGEVWLKASNSSQVMEIASIVQQTLGRARLGANDFEVVVPQVLLEQRNRAQRTFAVVVGSVAFVSLLIGGIGIMNMMLMSVLERTPEIGLRRTVGATRRAIGLQFLTESAMMAFSGGLLGIVLGAGVSRVVTAYAGWDTHVSLISVVLAFLTATSVGVVFGSYPALKAARLQPIDAVRYE